MALGRRAVVVAVAASTAIAALAAMYALTTWVLTGDPPRMPPLESTAAQEASVPVATASSAASESPLESLVPLESPLESAPESMTAPPPSDSAPPCRRYYPACGKFSMPGVVADEDCGCRADETCSRSGATGWCVRRPRWLGPQN
jgi:hypothetical protein